MNIPVDESNFSLKVKSRFIFLGKFMLALIFNFIFFVLIKQIFELNQQLEEIGYILGFWGFFSLSTIIGTAISYQILSKFFMHQENTKQYQLNLLFVPFKISKVNIKEQLRYTAILFFIIYLPIDLIGYYIPHMLDFSAASLLSNRINNYLNYSLLVMIPVTILVHFCVAFREEFLIRNYFLVIGEEELNSSTAYLFSAIYFGLAHFNYIFSSGSENYSSFFPIYWGLSATIIGLAAGLVFIKKKMIWPLILSHWANNIVSSIAVRNHVAGILFNQTVIYLYLPLLILSFIFFIMFKTDIRKGIQVFFTLIRNYRLENLPPEQIISKSNSVSSNDLIKPPPQESLLMFILTDILIVALLWILSLFLV